MNWRRAHGAQRWLPLVVGLAGLLASALTVWSLESALDRSAEERLTTATGRVVAGVDAAVRESIATARAVSGAVAARDRTLPDTATLRRATRAVALGRPLTEAVPGLQAVAVAAPSAGAGGAAIVATAPASVGDLAGDRLVAGVVAGAVWRSTELGVALVTGRIEEGPFTQVGGDVVVAVPLYDAEAAELPTASTATRREAALGWVLAVLDVDEIAARSVSEAATPVAVAVHDGTSVDEAPLGQAGTTDLPLDRARQVVLPVAGRSWTVAVAPTAPLRSTFERAQPWLAGGSGVLISAAAAFIVWLLVSQRARAEALVARATGDLEEANEGLARSNRELKQFAGVVSHDLKSPLTAVRGYLDVLERLRGDTLDPQSIEFIRRARDGTDRMRHLIDDLLAYAEMEQAHVDPQPVDLSLVVEEVQQDLEAQIDNRAARIDVGVLHRVSGDASRLRQMLVNVVGNALKFVPDGRAPHVRISSRPVADGVELRVDDNGVGIPPEDRARVLEAFARSDRTAQFEGTGLGLAIVGRIVQAHGGTIRLDDSPLGGASVRITLPAAGPPSGRAAPATEPSSAAQVSSGRGGREVQRR